MKTSTLGGLIKDFRLKKRLSQLEISLKIGWKDASRLSKIEQGRVGRPTRQTIEKIIRALNLDEQDKNRMLLTSGILPNNEESLKVTQNLKAIIKELNLPVILIDYSWRIHHFNDLTKRLYKIEDQVYTSLTKEKLNWLEFMITQSNYLEIKITEGFSPNEPLSGLKHVIALFKYENSENTGEKWYKQLVHKLNNIPSFKDEWYSTDPTTDNHLLYEYECHKLQGSWLNQSRTLYFNVFSIHPTFDSRFWLMIYSPADLHTTSLYNEIVKD